MSTTEQARSRKTHAHRRKLLKKARLIREARCIVAFASLWPDTSPPSYRLIAQLLNQKGDGGMISAKAIDYADEVYNDANGADDWEPASEEATLERLNVYLEITLGDL